MHGSSYVRVIGQLRRAGSDGMLVSESCTQLHSHHGGAVARFPPQFSSRHGSTMLGPFDGPCSQGSSASGHPLARQVTYRVVDLMPVRVTAGVRMYSWQRCARIARCSSGVCRRPPGSCLHEISWTVNRRLINLTLPASGEAYRFRHQQLRRA